MFTKVAIAYAVVAWVLIQVATQVFPFFEIQVGWCGPLFSLLIIGFPSICLSRGHLKRRPRESQRTEAADAVR